MGNEKMNVFERATLFAAEVACKNLGVKITAKVVPDVKAGADEEA